MLFLPAWLLAAESSVQAQAAQAGDPCHSLRGTAPLTGLERPAVQVPARPSPASWLRTAPAAPPCRPALPPQPGPRALVPALRGEDPAIPLPKPSASAGSQTCSVAAAAAAAAAILVRCSLRLRSGTGVGLIPSLATPRHAPATPPKESRVGKESAGSDSGRWVTCDLELLRVGWAWQGPTRSGVSSLERTPSKCNTCLSFPHTWNAVSSQAAMT